MSEGLLIIILTILNINSSWSFLDSPLISLKSSQNVLAIDLLFFCNGKDIQNNKIRCSFYFPVKNYRSYLLEMSKHRLVNRPEHSFFGLFYTYHNPLWLYWTHTVCKALLATSWEVLEDFWHGKDTFMKFYLFIFNFTCLHSRSFCPQHHLQNWFGLFYWHCFLLFRFSLVSCAVACVYEPREVFQGSLTWHINTSGTFESIQCHCQWQRRMTHHSAWQCSSCMWSEK